METQAVDTLQSMFANNAAATLYAVLTVAGITAAAAIWRFFTGRVAHRDSVEKESAFVELTRTTTAAMVTQTELNRQISEHMRRSNDVQRDQQNLLEKLLESNTELAATFNMRFAEVSREIKKVGARR